MVGYLGGRKVVQLDMRKAEWKGSPKAAKKGLNLVGSMVSSTVAYLVVQRVDWLVAR